MEVAFLFPGQGTQYVGMGTDVAAAFPEARRVAREADDVLGYEISRLCAEGPEQVLGLTEHAQPAILTLSVMLLRVLESRTSIRPAVAAGHSLGEYSALVASGALDFADAVRTVRSRGRLMQTAVAAGSGAMAAVAGLDEVAIRTICREAREVGEVLEVANFNGATQVVIAGHAAAVERAMRLAKTKGARFARPLSVSAPFHCPLMAPAGRGLAEVLRGIRFRQPRVPVVSNVDGAAVADPSAFGPRLVAQVEQPVRWDRCLETVAGLGCAQALEIGPGNVLSGLVRRMGLGLSSRPIGGAEALQELLTEGNA